MTSSSLCLVSICSCSTTYPGREGPTTQLLEYHVGPPTEDVARELTLAEGREVACIKRLRWAPMLSRWP